MNNYIEESLWEAAEKAVKAKDLPAIKEIVELLASSPTPVLQLVEEDYEKRSQQTLQFARLLDGQQYLLKNFFAQPTINPSNFSVAQLRDFLLKNVNTRIWRDCPDWTNRMKDLFRSYYANPKSPFYKGFISLDQRGRYRIEEPFYDQMFL